MQTSSGSGLFNGFKRMLTGEGFFITTSGEVLMVDTGCMCALEPGVDYDENARARG